MAGLVKLATQSSFSSRQEEDVRVLCATVILNSSSTALPADSRNFQGSNSS